MTKNPKTVAIMYGLNEGPFMGRRLRRSLHEAGFTVINDPVLADIIIAHSGACFVLAPRPDQHVILIGLPYWPGRSLLGALGRKVIGDIQTHHREGELPYWLRKSFWNLVYFWRMPNNIRMFRGRSQGRYWLYPHVTLVRNAHDAMCTPDIPLTRFKHKPVFVELPGHHDDCWLRPAPIVRLVQQAVRDHK
jgi:hypothetical protein